MQSYDLSIVIPIYKPKDGWVTPLLANMEKARKVLPMVNIQFILVNDGFESSYLTSLFELLQEEINNLKIISYPYNRGKGYALRTGVNIARGKYVITTDADFPYEMHNLAEVYRKLVDGNDIVAGKRNDDYYKSTPLQRKVLSKTCTALNKMVLQLPNCDTQSGLKGFNSHGRRVFLNTTIDRFLVDTEFLVMAVKQNLSIAVIHLNLKEGTNFSSMGMKVVLQELRNFVTIIKHSRTAEFYENKNYYVAEKSISDVRFRRV
jgi:glycosyltransferase involved in cell wall biosynthesis